jgi:hypothetical protein
MPIIFFPDIIIEVKENDDVVHFERRKFFRITVEDPNEFSSVIFKTLCKIYHSEGRIDEENLLKLMGFDYRRLVLKKQYGNS